MSTREEEVADIVASLRFHQSLGATSEGLTRIAAKAIAKMLVKDAIQKFLEENGPPPADDAV